MEATLKLCVYLKPIRNYIQSNSLGSAISAQWRGYSTTHLSVCNNKKNPLPVTLTPITSPSIDFLDHQYKM